MVKLVGGGSVINGATSSSYLLFRFARNTENDWQKVLLAGFA